MAKTQHITVRFEPEDKEAGGMGCTLKQARESCGLTQREVAEILQVSSRAYQNYEAGKRTPPLATAFVLAELFNTPIEHLFQYIKEGGEKKEG